MATVVGDELDLHTFAPREVADVVAEYVAWAAEEGRTRVRIIHGKGTGALRRTVHAVLRRHPAVVDFGLSSGDRGGWGSTWAELRPTAPKAPAGPPADAP
ncbi:MAG: Smr/MutS family protein [Kofleriaceae bacterium]